MGTTAEKGAYIIGTKSLLKDKINNLGGEITDETTFREYTNQLQNVYDKLPKTEYQEGTEVNLGVTSKGKLDFENGVVGIGQSSQDSRQGYNLCQAKLPTTTNSGITITNNNDGTFTINGTNSSTGTTTFRLNQSTQNGIDNLQNYEDGTYTLDLGIQNENLGINLMQNSTWTNFISTGFNVRLKSQAITNATNTFIYIGIKGSATLNNVVIKPMLVKGSYTTSTIPSFEQYGVSPSPSYQQTINSVTGNQDVVVSGKNLLNINNWVKGRINNSTGDIEYASNVSSMAIGENDITFVVSQAWNSGIASDFIPISTDDYVFKYSHNREITMCIDTYDNQKLRISRVVAYTQSSTPTTYTFTISDSSVSYIRIHFEVNTANVEYNVSDMQLEKGTQATPYEPYITPQTYQLSLGDIELNAIGNYKDELIYDVDEDKVYKIEKIGKVVLNGTQGSFSKPSTNRFNIDNIPTDYLKSHNNNTSISNFYVSFEQKGSNADFDTLVSSVNYGIELSSNVSESIHTIRIKDTRYDDIDQYKTWLSTNNVILYYVLATPTLTEITDETLHTQVKLLYNAHSLNGTTIITSYGNLPMIVKVRGLKGE